MRTSRELDKHVSYKSLEASHYSKGALADLSDFGLLESKVPQNVLFPALEADEPPCKIWRRYSFILGEEIRNRTNTHEITKNKQTVNDISTPYISACVNNKT